MEEVDDRQHQLRKIESIEAAYRKRLAEASESGDQHLERVATLTLEQFGLMKEVLHTPPGVSQSLLKIRESDLAIERFRVEIEWWEAQGEELPVNLKRQALQRATQHRKETEALLQTQQPDEGIHP